MTGAYKLGRKELISKVESMGLNFSESVNSKVSLLLVDSVDSTSSKTTKAKKLGIPIKTYTEFFSD